MVQSTIFDSVLINESYVSGLKRKPHLARRGEAAGFALSDGDLLRLKSVLGRSHYVLTQAQSLRPSLF